MNFTAFSNEETEATLETLPLEGLDHIISFVEESDQDNLALVSKKINDAVVIDKSYHKVDYFDKNTKDELFSLEKIEKVTSLILTEAPQDKQEWKTLGEKFPNVKELRANNLELKNIDCVLDAFSDLTSLNLSYNRIGDEGKKVLCKIANQKNMRLVL